MQAENIFVSMGGGCSHKRYHSICAYHFSGGTDGAFSLQHTNSSWLPVCPSVCYQERNVYCIRECNNSAAPETMKVLELVGRD